jgi:iron complex transport system substrate-binding protein
LPRFLIKNQAVREILKAGARFLGPAPKNLADIDTDIATIAGAAGVGDRGEELIAAMQQSISDVRSPTAASARPRVWCEEWGKPLIASETGVAELVEAAGGDFMSTPGRQTAAEEVQRLSPEVIVTAWCGAGERVPREKIIAQRGWQNTAAGLSRRIFCIGDELLNTPAPPLVEGLQALAFAIRPEFFPGAKGIRQITALPASRAENATR